MTCLADSPGRVTGVPSRLAERFAVGVDLRHAGLAEVLADHDVGGELGPPAGISASFISKTTEPSGLLMRLVRLLQVTEAKGSSPAFVKWRGIVRPPFGAPMPPVVVACPLTFAPRPSFMILPSPGLSSFRLACPFDSPLDTGRSSFLNGSSLFAGHVPAETRKVGCGAGTLGGREPGGAAGGTLRPGVWASEPPPVPLPYLVVQLTGHLPTVARGQGVVYQVPTKTQYVPLCHRQHLPVIRGYGGAAAGVRTS